MFYARNPQVRERLAGTLVSIVGCGSFGSAMADMLARAGIGRLALIDPETLAVENLGRHVLTAADVGQPKAFALARRLREINPELQIDARQERFRGAEGVLVCCADSRRCESLVNAISLANGLPAMYVGAYGAVRAGEVQVVVPSRTACRECFAQFRGNEEAVSGPERYTDPDFGAGRLRCGVPYAAGAARRPRAARLRTPAVDRQSGLRRLPAIRRHFRQGSPRLRGVRREPGCGSFHRFGGIKSLTTVLGRHNIRFMYLGY